MIESSDCSLLLSCVKQKNMDRISTSQESVVWYLRRHSPEVFIEMMSKLLSDDRWSDNIEFIVFNVNEKTKTIVEVYVGMHNNSAQAVELTIMNKTEFIDVIKAVTKSMVRKFPDHRFQLRELRDRLVLNLKNR